MDVVTADHRIDEFAAEIGHDPHLVQTILQEQMNTLLLEVADARGPGKLRYDICPVCEDTQLAKLAAAFTIRNCRRNCRLVDIQPNEGGKIHVVRPLMDEARRRPVRSNPPTVHAVGWAT